MSGIVGIFNLDGAPVDRQLLGRMTEATMRRGPDGSGIWCSGHVGFGHTLLRDSPGSDGEHQPCTLDGKVWVTADARIDGRAELISALRAAGRQLATDATAAELILHAYYAFGESFLQHLIGDFAFALWDGRKALLLCARDHFGVRPFFYAKTDNAFIFGTELDAVLEHPSVSTQLNEHAIGDFLLFNAFLNPEFSIYRDVRRLPPASRIHLTREACRVSRYWQIPAREEIHYSDYAECVERFQEVFARAVNDRAQTPRVAVELSGGMDSTSIAAVLATGAQARGRTVSAHTISCEGLVGDPEPRYARMVALHLGVPIVVQESQQYALFERIDQPEFVTQEPQGYPLLAAHYDRFSAISASGTRVLLTGQGGDAVFGGASPDSLESQQPAHALRRLVEMYRHVRQTGTLRGLGLREALMTTLGRPTDRHPDFPDWIDADFARRTDLHDRWRAGWKIIDNAIGIQRQLSSPLHYPSLFSDYEVLRLPLVVRHPYFDVRLMTFLLHLADTVTTGKKLLRDAMRGKLPEEIRLRPKIGMLGDPVRARFTTGKLCIPMERRLTLVGGIFVDPDRYERAFARYLGGKGSKSTWTSYHMGSPIALNVWLTQRTSHKLQRGYL